MFAPSPVFIARTPLECGYQIAVVKPGQHTHLANIVYNKHLSSPATLRHG